MPRPKFPPARVRLPPASTLRSLFAVVSHELLMLVEPPVGLGIPVRFQGAKPQDRFGRQQAPSRPGDTHPVLHQVPARSLDHPRRDRPPTRQVVAVAKVGRVLVQVPERGDGLLASFCGQRCSRDLLKPRKPRSLRKVLTMVDRSFTARGYLG